jgi:hypothetical protein
MIMTTQSGRSLFVDRRYNGPVASGNGGYSAGLAARLVAGDDEAVEATLRAPVPLDQRLRVQETVDGVNILTDDAANRILVMSLRSTHLDTPQIASPGLAAASIAAASFRGAEDHALPTCFVCGPAREPGDGLRIFPDFVSGKGDATNPNPFPIVASPWTPTSDLADADGRVAREFVWAALDCPGAFAVDKEPILLGRMSAQILDRPRPDDACVVVAWARGSDRRKHFAGTALFSARGDLLAFSEQTWIQIEAHAHTLKA